MSGIYKDIRVAMADAIRNRISGWQVHAYVLANPNPPTIWIMPGDIEYDRAFQRGLDIVNMKVQAFVAITSDIASQEKLDQLLEDDLKTALESDRTLGGLIDHLHVTDATGYRTSVVEGRGPILLCEWDVEIMLAQ